MERQNEPLTQKKPWSELTEEERAAIRESWKHTLPEEFDVYCIGDLTYDLFDETPNIPGRLYVSGNVDYCDINVGGDSIIHGYVDGGDINVGGDSIIHSYVDCCNINVGGDSIIHGYIDCGYVNVGRRFIVDDYVDCLEVNVGDLFDCHDVVSHGQPIYAADYVCRCYVEES